MADLVSGAALRHSEVTGPPGRANPPSSEIPLTAVKESSTLGRPQSPTLRAQQSNTPRLSPPSRPNLVELQSSLGIRRLPSTPRATRAPGQSSENDVPDNDGGTTGRRRSLSAPQWVQRSSMPRKDLRRQTTSGSYLSAVAEGELSAGLSPPQPLPLGTTTTRRFRSGSTSARSTKALQRWSSKLSAPAEDEYESEVVDLLDIVGRSFRRHDDRSAYKLTRSRS